MFNNFNDRKSSIPVRSEIPDVVGYHGATTKDS